MLAVKRCLLGLALTSLALVCSASFASSLNDAIRPERMTLDNGLDVYLKARPGSGSVAIVAAVKVGSRYETLRQRGLTHFVEHMVFDGTSRRSRQDLKQGLMARGGEPWGYTRDYITEIGLTLPAGELEFGLKWLAEMLFDSTFPAERIEVERRILTREEVEHEWGGLWWRLTRAEFDGNSYVRGPKDLKWVLRNVKRLPRQDLLRFYKAQYVPNNVVLTVVGDFDLASARAQVKGAFGAARRGRPAPAGARRPLVAAAGRVRVADRGSFKQSAVWCGYAVPNCTMEESDCLRWVFWLIAYRAGERIREGEGLSYHVSYHNGHASEHWPQDAGLFMTYADCRHADIGRVERILREELARVRTEPITRREAAMMRVAAAEGWREVAQDNRRLASTLIGSAMWDTPSLDFDRMVASLTPEQIQRTAQRYLKPGHEFVAYWRPPKTPLELGATGALMLAVSIILMVVARRRNRRLAPPAEHVGELLPAHYTLRFVAANVLEGIVWGIPAAFILWWPFWKLSNSLFSRAMFGPDLLLHMAWAGVLIPFLLLVGFTLVVKQVTISREGLLLVTRGYHMLLPPQRIASIQAGTVSMWRAALDPRCMVFGGDPGRWAIVRTAGGFTVCLGVRDPEQFVEQARGYLQESGAEAAPAAGGE